MIRSRLVYGTGSGAVRPGEQVAKFTHCGVSCPTGWSTTLRLGEFSRFLPYGLARLLSRSTRISVFAHSIDNGVIVGPSTCEGFKWTGNRP